MSDISPLNGMYHTTSGQNEAGNQFTQINIDSLHQYPDKALAKAVADALNTNDGTNTLLHQGYLDIYYPILKAETGAETLKSVKINVSDRDRMITRLSFSKNCHLIYGPLNDVDNIWYPAPLPQGASLEDASCYVEQLHALTTPIVEDILEALKYSQEEQKTLLTEYISRFKWPEEFRNVEASDIMQALLQQQETEEMMQTNYSTSYQIEELANYLQEIKQNEENLISMEMVNSGESEKLLHLNEEYKKNANNIRDNICSINTEIRTKYLEHQKTQKTQKTQEYLCYVSTKKEALSALHDKLLELNKKKKARNKSNISKINGAR